MKRFTKGMFVPLFLCQAWPANARGDSSERARRIQTVVKTRGFVALWDFVLRGSDGRFDAHKAKNVSQDLRLDATNYVREFWNLGRAATYEDFPLLGRGPFGQAIQIRKESDPNFRPSLMIPRDRIHNSRLDVKGPGKSVSVVAWIIRESGAHAIAGIWHEGTDLKTGGPPATRIERGKRQYALFLGLAANPGGAAGHVSENGEKSFGDRYARNLSVTPEKVPELAADSPPEQLDAAWAVVAFAFDNQRNTVTSYLNGVATEYWIDNPSQHPFYQWPARGWLQAQLHAQPGQQEGEDPSFPRDQFYQPPEDKPRRRTILSQTADQRTELHEFAFTKVKVTLRRQASGKFVVEKRELAALRVNPFWFAHDLYSPSSLSEGGPFTIGRVIQSNRGLGTTGYLGAVAVFDRALSPSEMARLAQIRKPVPAPASKEALAPRMAP
ncbi:MAG: hypothetical protein NZV14_18165 [Bryobacteraceae bacterium]|nr:hypothetical protein [Bryobacteraceae bacterium]MDW8380091.1 hypothetical protein [Bryobacterales bacterium]